VPASVVVYWGYPGENQVIERVYDGVMGEVQQSRSADGEPSGDPQPWLFGPGPGATPQVKELDDDALIGFTVHSQRSRSRTARVVAEGDVEAFCITRERFEKLLHSGIFNESI